MGGGLGWALRQGGVRVVSTVEGRSARTARLARAAALELLPSLDEVVATSRIVLLVAPPDQALDVAHAVASAARSTGARPLVVDLNAVSPSTIESVAAALAPLPLVDGSISGPPPIVRPGARIYLSGPRAAEVVALPWGDLARPIPVGDRLGSASALKMCTASVYKGLNGLMIQAMRTATQHGVLDAVLADLTGLGLDYQPSDAGLAATKAHRYVGEMHEIAATQRAAGLTPALFESFAEVFAEMAGTALAAEDPEAIDPRMTASAVVEGLSRRNSAAAGDA